MEDFYSVLKKFELKIYNQDTSINPIEFFARTFNIEIKIDYPEDISEDITKDISTIISIFHFFDIENAVISKSKGDKFFNERNQYNYFRDAYSEGIFDLSNSLLLLSVGSPVQSVTTTRRAFEGLIKGFYSLINDHSKYKKKQIVNNKIIDIIEDIVKNYDIKELLEENNLEEYIHSRLESLQIENSYDEIKRIITFNRRGNEQNSFYIIYQRLCDFAHIYEQKKTMRSL